MSYIHLFLSPSKDFRAFMWYFFYTFCGILWSLWAFAAFMALYRSIRFVSLFHHFKWLISCISWHERWEILRPSNIRNRCEWFRIHHWSGWSLENLEWLEQGQSKNNSILSKKIPILKLPRFLPNRIGGEKSRQFQSWIFFDWMELFLYCLGSRFFSANTYVHSLY